MKTKLFLSLTFAFLGFIVISSLNSIKVAAATCRWTGTFSGDTDVVANWTNCGGGFPGNGDSLIFPAGASNQSINHILPGTFFNQITIQDAYTFDLADFEINNNGSIISEASGVIFNNNIKALSNITIIGEVPNLTINGNVDLNNFNITFDTDTSGGIVINGVISGNGSIDIEGVDGNTQFSSTNTFIGDIEVNGNLLVRNSAGLGNSANQLVVNQDGALILQNNINLPNDMTFNTGSAVLNSSQNNEISGDIELNSMIQFSVDLNNLELSGEISGTGGIRKEGVSGNLILSGNGANTFDGNLIVADGIVELNKNGVAAMGLGEVTVGDDSGVLGSATLLYSDNNQLHNTTVMEIRPEGVLDVDGHSDFIERLNIFEGVASINNGSFVVLDLQMIGGTVATGVGSIGVANSLSMTGGFVGPAEIDGILSVGAIMGGVDFTGANSASKPDGLISAVIIGSSDIRINGDYEFAGDNIATGDVTMGGGRLNLVGQNNFATLTLNGSGIVHVHGDSSATDFTVEDGALWSDGATGNVVYNSLGSLFASFTAGDEFGVATVIGNVTMDSTSGIEFSIDGLTRGGSYSALDATGTVNLNNAYIAAINYGFVPALGDTFIVIDASSVVGTFYNQPDGSTFRGMNDIYFRINYTTDQVILTAVAAPVPDPTLSPTGIKLPTTLIAFTTLMILSGFFIFKRYEN